jgi:hypothetical protein
LKRLILQSFVCRIIDPGRLYSSASVGFAVAVLAGWMVEAAVKWAVDWVLSHFQ